jgi:hypothetical protein
MGLRASARLRRWRIAQGRPDLLFIFPDPAAFLVFVDQHSLSGVAAEVRDLWRWLRTNTLPSGAQAVLLKQCLERHVANRKRSPFKVTAFLRAT